MKRLLLLLALLASPAYAVGTLGYVNVKDYGALGNGVADDWPALQHVIDNVAAERATIYIPAGHYVVSQTLNCGAKSFNFRGDGRPMPYNVWQGGTYIRGTIAGPILTSAYPAGMLSIEDMGFANRHASGRGLLLSGSNVALLRVSVIANKAIEMAPNAFTTSMQQIVVRPQAGFPAGSVGIAFRGHTLLHGFDAVGFDIALRMTGIGNDVRSGRVEVNRIAVEIGVNPDGTTNPMTGGGVASLSLEANRYGIVTRSATSVSVRDVLIQGTTNSPELTERVRKRHGRDIADKLTALLATGSNAGLVVHHSQWTAYEQVIASGGFSEAAIKVMPSQPTTVPIRFVLCKASNTLPGGVTWDTRPPDPMLVLEQCS